MERTPLGLARAADKPPIALRRPCFLISALRGGAASCRGSRPDTTTPHLLTSQCPTCGHRSEQNER
jgi:hypothetical protein